MPTVPRKRKRANFSVLQYIEDNPCTTWEANYPETTVNNFKPLHMEAIKQLLTQSRTGLNN